jgi:hypothetical protein
MTLINCTPHAIVLCGRPLLASGVVSRVTEHASHIDDLDWLGGTVPLDAVLYGEVVDLPDPRPFTYYIVSRPVAEAVPHRLDVVFLTDFERDAGGQVVGARRLGRKRVG